MLHFIHVTIAFLLAVGEIPVVFYGWHRLDRLIVCHNLARGTRHQARLLRMIGATFGAWLGYTGLLALALGQWVPALLLVALWALLSVSSAFSRRHDLAPWWYNRVSI